MSVTLYLLRGSLIATNHFTTHGTCWVDAGTPLPDVTVAVKVTDCSNVDGLGVPAGAVLVATDANLVAEASFEAALSLARRMPFRQRHFLCVRQIVTGAAYTARAS